VTARKLLLAYAGDVMLGAPDEKSPFEAFGSIAARAQEATYAPDRNRGALVTGVLIGGAALTARRAGLVKTVWATLGGNALRRDAQELVVLLDQRELDDARELIGALTGVDAAELSVAEIRAEAVDWLAGGTADEVVGPLFWAALLGPAGAAGYAAINTLDAIFDDHEQFGWVAARLAETMNWPVARLSAALTLLTASLVDGSDELTRAINRSLYVGAAAALTAAAIRWGLKKTPSPSR
jgi:adenosylcobinamide-phosphate synthase